MRVDVRSVMGEGKWNDEEGEQIVSGKVCRGRCVEEEGEGVAILWKRPSCILKSSKLRYTEGGDEVEELERFQRG